jgi:hypothetical protein
MASKTPPPRKQAPLPARRSPPAGRIATSLPNRSTTPAPAKPTPPTPPAPRPQPAPAASAAPAAPAAASTAPARPRKRSAPMGRALKFSRLADKNVRRLARLVTNWHGEATPDQQKLNAGIVALLPSAQAVAEKLLAGVGLLANTKFAPTEGAAKRSATPLAAGARVAIKEKFYVAAVHGATNDFEVVVAVDKIVKIRPTGDLRAAQIVLPQSQLERLDDAGDDDGDEVGTEGDAEGDAEGDPEAVEGEEGTEALPDEPSAVDDETEDPGELATEGGDPAELNFEQSEG